MRQAYWCALSDIVESERYYWYYRSQSKQMDRIVNCILAVTSLASIASWAIWQQHQWLWALIIGAAQILSAIRSQLPYASQVTSISYLLPELRALILEMEITWMHIENGDIPDGNDMASCIYGYKSRFEAIETKYCGGPDFHVSQRALKKAEVDRELILQQQFGTVVYDENIGEVTDNG